MTDIMSPGGSALRCASSSGCRRPAEAGPLRITLEIKNTAVNTAPKTVLFIDDLLAVDCYSSRPARCRSPARLSGGLSTALLLRQIGGGVPPVNGVTLTHGIA